ncbi:MAG: hypothetical protein N2053_09685 [Chitinispirillaceae bacterium]|nr:hypothetical protein [Chitinispirillaceae bacterium]
MDNMWEKIKKSLKEGAALSMEKIEEYTKLGKLKIEELSAKRKCERNLVDIGERVVELIRDKKEDSIAQDLTIRKAYENINSLMEEIAEIEKKMKEIIETSKKNKEKKYEEEEINGI